MGFTSDIKRKSLIEQSPEVAALREQLQQSPRGLKDLSDECLAKLILAKQKRTQRQATRSFTSGRKSLLAPTEYAIKERRYGSVCHEPAPVPDYKSMLKH